MRHKADNAHAWMIAATLLAFAMVAMPHAALAQIEGSTYGTLTCTGATATGQLYQSSGAMCAGTGVGGFFLTIVCRVEAIISQIFGAMYCGIQFALLQPLAGVLSLYVAFSGILFMIGAIQPSMGEVTIRFLKLVIVWVLSTSAPIMIGFVYTSLMSFMQFSVQVVLSSNVMGAPATTTGMMMTFTSWLDNLWAWQAVNTVINNPSLGALLVLILIFPGGALLVGIVLQFVIATLTVFARAVLGYLMALVGVTFLLTLAPIFLSLALFKTTQDYFNGWIKHILGYAIQMMIVFAFIAISEVYFPNILQVFQDMWAQVVPYNITVGYPPFSTILPLWTIETTPGSGVGMTYTQILQQPGRLIDLLVVPVVGWLIAAYMLNAFLEMVPEIARQLSGLNAGSRLGGITPAEVTVDRHVIQTTGGRSASEASDAAGDAYWNTEGNFIQRSGAAISKGSDTFTKGVQDELIDDVTHLGGAQHAPYTGKGRGGGPQATSADRWFYMLNK